MKAVLLSASLVALIFLTGCAAVWGKGYNVVYENSEGIMIEYDPYISSASTIARVAEEAAGKYGRNIVPGEHEPAHYRGIHQRFYKFVPPTSPNP